MKINHQVLSIPPYISTSWKNINSILVDQSGNLVILLHTNAKISIPNLEKSIINVIFDAHAKFLENDEKEKTQKTGSALTMGMPLKIGVDGIESLGSAMQHNSANANSPDLPPDMLNKIASISKIMGIDSPEMMPKAEPHCNCPHCQIARAIRGEAVKGNEINEEVSEEDLKFKTWDISQTGDQLYVVANPLDENEKYTVFLGNPLGCTCGEKNCEHLRAVLNS
jgi:hypothetical protein